MSASYGMEDEVIEEAVETLLKAHEIQNNKELMRIVEPLLEEKINSLKQLLSFKDLRKLASDKALEEQKEKEKIDEDYYSTGKVLGEGQDQLKVPGKNS